MKPETPIAARPFKIVMVDDLEGPLLSTEMVTRFLLKDSTMLKFQRGDDAMRELAREEPDLLITDVCHRGPSGYEMLQLLAAKRVNFPILIISATATQEKVSQSAGGELNVRLLQTPWTMESLRRELVNLVGPIEYENIGERLNDLL